MLSDTAVQVWRAITDRALVATGPDLTNRQTAILLTVHTESGPHTVRGLAEHHGLLKPAVVRALDTLEAAGLVQRTPDPADRRSVLILPTEAGAALIADMAASIARMMAETTADRPVEGGIDAAGSAGAAPTERFPLTGTGD